MWQPALFDDGKQKVYILTDNEFVKIGKTVRSVDDRGRQLQIGNPRDLHVIAIIPGADERKVQALFAADHIQGEWYRLSPQIVAFVEAWNMIAVVMCGLAAPVRKIREVS